MFLDLILFDFYWSFFEFFMLESVSNLLFLVFSIWGFIFFFSSGFITLKTLLLDILYSRRLFWMILRIGVSIVFYCLLSYFWSFSINKKILSQSFEFTIFWWILFGFKIFLLFWDLIWFTVFGNLFSINDWAFFFLLIKIYLTNKSSIHSSCWYYAGIFNDNILILFLIYRHKIVFYPLN